MNRSRDRIKKYSSRLQRISVQAALMCLMPLSLQALTLAQCDRITHVSHGGESDQTDLGEGRVMYTTWWSQEGTSKDITVMDCESGAALRFRAAETNMTRGRTSFDRVDAALDVIALHESGARAFATLDRIAADLNRIVRDIELYTAEEESCACAALYPDTLNGKSPFDLEASTAKNLFAPRD